MMLWSSFDDVGLEDRFTEEHQCETYHGVQNTVNGQY